MLKHFYILLQHESKRISQWAARDNYMPNQDSQTLATRGSDVSCHRQPAFIQWIDIGAHTVVLAAGCFG